MNTQQENTNVSEINNCDGCRADMPLRNGIYHIDEHGKIHMICSKNRYKEQPTTVSVEEAAMEFASLGKGEGYSTSEYDGFIEGANWQKEQDKQIISECLEVLQVVNNSFETTNNKFKNSLMHNGIKEAITKTKQHLNQ